MADGDEAVLEQSTKHGLGNLLAAEFHLEKAVEDGVEDSWCARKHLINAATHFIAEASQHCNTWDKCTAHTYHQLKELEGLVDDVLHSSDPPDPGYVKMLRNRFREIMDPYFPHLTQVESECTVCKDDSLTDEERLRLIRKEESVE